MLGWLTVVLVVGGICVLLAFIGTIVIHQSCRKPRKDGLFGSTIKTAPGLPHLESVKIPVQPRGSHEEDFQVQLTNADSEQGLSSRFMRWSSQDKGSAAFGEGSAQGPVWIVWYKIHYLPGQELLQVAVFRAKCTPARHLDGLDTNVYIVLFLLPDEKSRQTSLYSNSGCPSFDETFHFPVSAEDLSSKTLRLSLYELDYSRTRICLGHAVTRLTDLPLENGGTHYLSKELEHLSSLDTPSPEVHVSLCYHVVNEKLKIQVFAARNLPQTPEASTFFLRTQVILGTKSVKTKKTEPTRTLSGVFQCSYAFQIPARHMDTCCLLLTVVQVEADGKHKPLGQVTIGPCLYAHGSGVQHWKDMMANSRKTTDMWHRLILAAPTS